jgi:hypothetical protein
MFIGVSFPFERNSLVCLITVFQFKNPIIILDYIEDIKENNQQLQLLSQMDFFVIDQYFIFLIFGVPNEDKREKSDAANF